MGQMLRGMVERVTFHSEETGYAVLRVRPGGGGELVTLVGCVPAVSAGEVVCAEGEWTDTNEYGRQFRARELRLRVPASPLGLEKYLGSGLIDGIGPSYAKRLVEKFGGQIFSIIENESRRLEEVEGIGEKRRKVIRESWMRQKATHEIMVFLFQNGLGTGRARRILKAYGENAVEQIQANPYRLVEDVSGIGFLTADGMAQKMGLDPLAGSRLRAGLLHVMDQAIKAGNTAMERGELCVGAAGLLGVEEMVVGGILEGLIRERTFLEEDVDGVTLVFAFELREAEKVIAACLRAMKVQCMAVGWEGAGREESLKHAGVVLSAGQENAVRLAMDNRLLLITGGPGVGKTTVVRTLLGVFAEAGLHTVLGAPTGRAARRLEASSGQKASTLHRLLEFDSEKGCKRWSGRPLEGDVFLVDEVSMVDTVLMAQFLRALPPHARLILVGDADQLPSVGPGRVLGDLVSAGVMVRAELQEIFRQAGESQIIRAAHAINKGRVPDFMQDKGLDCYFIERSVGETLATLVDLVVRRIPSALGLNAVEDVQTLTPMNVRTLGAGEINVALQSALNPPRPDLMEIPRGTGFLRMGDRVMQRRNDYEKDVFNGDIGRVVAIQPHPLEVTVMFENKRVAVYMAWDLEDIVLAHAITIHKSQGSEFPAVVIPVVSAHHVMLRRNLMYTAVTRGKRFVVLVGEAGALATAVRRTDGDERLTGLQHWLKSF